MKSAFKPFVFAILSSMFFIFFFEGCSKDQLSQNLKQSEVVAQAHTIELQQIFLLETLLSDWDSLILPFGIKPQILDQKPEYKKMRILVENARLFGDYIERKGNFNYEIFEVNGHPDSIVCSFNLLDSFSVFSSNGQYILEGFVALKSINMMNHRVYTNLQIHFPKFGKYDFKSGGNCLRILKNPTISHFEDGFRYSAISTCANQKLGIQWNSISTELQKNISGPNFPITGKITTQSNEDEKVEIDFNAFNDFSLDKIAKANQKSTEWIFDIQ